MRFASLNRTSDAGTEPVTLTEAKSHLRVTASDDDTLITSLITAARQACEDYCSRAFITQTWKATFNGLENGSRLTLPRPLLISVSSVKYKNSSGDLTLVSSSDYEVDADSEPGVIRFDDIPAFDTKYQNPLQVIYTAGYGAAADVPEDIKLAIKFAVAIWYEARMGTELPKGVRAILANYRIYNLT